MRKQLHKSLEKCRFNSPQMVSPIGANYGAFLIRRFTAELRVISSGDGGEWEHVSVSMADRCPTWEEMSYVKQLFWSDDETVIQFHLRKTMYVNTHEFCLHLWKKSGEEVEFPPMMMV